VYLKVVAVISGSLFATQLFAADQAADPVSVFVRAEMQNQHIPGLTLVGIEERQADPDRGIRSFESRIERSRQARNDLSVGIRG